MADFTIEIAGCSFGVRSIFESNREYCKRYLTGEMPQLQIAPQPEDLAFEQAMLEREAIEEGMKIRKFADPFLERAAIQRAVAEFLFERDVLMLHGSTVAVDGKGYLFTAKCGTGKSTHTRLWCQVFGDRAVMVNDDKPFLKITDDGVWVCGAPWSGKHGLDTNVTVPLAGICVLERGQKNSIALCAADTVFPMLVHQSYCPLDPRKKPALEALITKLVDKIPLWHMQCNKDPDAALIAHKAMSEV